MLLMKPNRTVVKYEYPWERGWGGAWGWGNWGGWGRGGERHRNGHPDKWRR